MQMPRVFGIKLALVTCSTEPGRPLPVGHSMRDVAGGDMRAGRRAVRLLIVEKHIGLIGTQEFGFIQPAKKDRLVDTNIPGPERANDALMGWRRTRGDQCGANGSLGRRKR